MEALKLKAILNTSTLRSRFPLQLYPSQRVLNKFLICLSVSQQLFLNLFRTKLQQVLWEIQKIGPVDICAKAVSTQNDNVHTYSRHFCNNLFWAQGTLKRIYAVKVKIDFFTITIHSLYIAQAKTVNSLW